MSIFTSALSKATDEKMIEKVYQDEIKVILGMMAKSLNKTQDTPEIDVITSINGVRTDGMISAKVQNGDIAVLLETKYNKNLSNKEEFVKVMCQCCNYLYRLRITSNIVPQIVVIGDIDISYTFNSEVLKDYFIAYSNMFIFGTNAANQWQMSNEMYNYMLKDANIESIYRSGVENFGVKSRNNTFRKELLSILSTVIASNAFINISINRDKLSALFNEFSAIYNDLMPKTNRPIIEKFIKFVQNPADCEIVEYGKTFGYKLDDRGNIEYRVKLDVHNNYGIAVIGGEEVGVSVQEFAKFKAYYMLLNDADKRYFEENCDTLLDDTDRRRKGDFYTPQIWVAEANKMLEQELGADWRDKYLVWDCAAGTKNLTRDYTFGVNNRNLLSTTISIHDVNIAADLNPGCASFDYDFLNDDVAEFEELMTLKSLGNLSIDDFKNTKLYRKGGKEFIQRLLSGEPLVFFINPPYGTAGSMGTNGQEAKTAIAKNKINEIMVDRHFGTCSQQLFAQFIYRIALIKQLFSIKNFTLALFSNSRIQCTKGYKTLRKYLRDNDINAQTAMMFCASEFDGCSNTWGVMFSIWNSGPHHDKLNVALKEYDKQKKEIKVIGVKQLYNLDNKENQSDWVKAEIVGLRGENAPQMTNALTWYPYRKRGNLLREALGYYYFAGDTLAYNTNYTFIMSSCAAKGDGISIIKDNILKVCTCFATRRLMSFEHSNWINCSDEYTVPNVCSAEYRQFELDSLIYSIFNTSSLQSSLRGIVYESDEWNIVNHFFWMSKQEIKDLAIEHNNEEVLEDIEEFGEDKRFTGTQYCQERFMYVLINTVLNSKNMQFSPDAKLVLDIANEIVKCTFSDRAILSRMDAQLLRDMGVRGNKLHGKDWHLNTWDAGWYQIKGLAQFNHKDKLERFNMAYKALEDRMRPLVYELGFLYK